MFYSKNTRQKNKNINSEEKLDKKVNTNCFRRTCCWALEIEFKFLNWKLSSFKFKFKQFNKNKRGKSKKRYGSSNGININSGSPFIYWIEDDQLKILTIPSLNLVF